MNKEPLSEWSKQWLEEVVPYIITDAEKTAFMNLMNEHERGIFIEDFWKKRDTSPNTPENEFKLEYYRRIALANKYFGDSGVDGWRTERGRIFILLGPPDEIQRDPGPSGSAFSAFQGPREVWNYWDLSNPRLPYNLEFVFVDKFGTGDYVLERSLDRARRGGTIYDLDALHYHFDEMENLAEALRNPFEKLDKLKGMVRTQVTYSQIPLSVDLFYFKGSEQGGYVPLVFEIPYSSLPSKTINDENFYSLTLLINVSNALGRIVYEKSKDINFSHPVAEMDSLIDKTFRHQTSLSLEQDVQKIHLLVWDNFSGKVGSVHQEVAIPDFFNDRLCMSDIILSSKESRETREARLIEDRLFRGRSNVFRSEEDMDVYFEVYNLTINPESGLNDLQVDYEFFNNGESIVPAAVLESDPTAETDCRIQASFMLKNFKPGEYLLRIRVADKTSGERVTKDTRFIVS